MSVDHGCSHVFMAHQILYGSVVVSLTKQIGREGVAKCMTTGSPNY